MTSKQYFDIGHLKVEGAEHLARICRARPGQKSVLIRPCSNR